MTPIQAEVLNKVNEMLKEHFDNSVVIVDTEGAKNCDRLFNASWNGGGLTNALGLVERMKHRLLLRSEYSDDPQED